MLRQTFEMEVEAGIIRLDCVARQGQGQLKVVTTATFPESCELSYFETDKLAKALKDTKDFGGLI